MYFGAAHVCFNAEPKSVQLAYYQSKKKSCLNKITLSMSLNLERQNTTSLKTTNAMWFCYRTFTREFMVS